MRRETGHRAFSNVFKIWLAALLLLASAVAASAQEARPSPDPCDDCPPTVTISGTIRDCAGVGVPGVTVVIQGGTGSTYPATTNFAGFYRVDGLPLDDYTITPTAATGFFFSPRNRETFFGTTGANFSRYRRDNRANFDGDCRTDISTFHRGNGQWRFIRSSDNQLDGFTLGVSGEIAAPGDYDGDGKTDGAVFNPGSGVWSVRRSSDNVTYSLQYGTTADIPVARDYDGDGRTDVAVFRPGNATWYIRRSSDGGDDYIPFGVTGDRVVPGDYDGDNRDDIAVFRPSDRTWYIRHPDGNFHGVPFGLASDWPAQADYDGDGKTDIAVFRPGPGDWYVLYSSNGGVLSTHWGASGDRPVPGDYDGDGRANIAVQRPDSQGVWWVLLDPSTGAHYGVSFLPAEFPVPAGYLTPLF